MAALMHSAPPPLPLHHARTPPLRSAPSMQECNVVQTFITACSSVAFTGGFGSYLTAMDRRSYEQLGEGAQVRGGWAWGVGRGACLPDCLRGPQVCSASARPCGGTPLWGWNASFAPE